MWHDMLTVQIPIVEKIIRTVAVYAIVVVLFRLSGKRGLAGVNTFDVVVIFLLSNVVQNAVIGPDNSLLGGLVGAVTLVVVNAAVTRWLARDPRAARLLEGTATVVVAKGELQQRALRRLALRPSEIEHAVRLQNGDGISDIAEGRLEPDGQLILTLKTAQQDATRGDIEALRTQLASIEDLLTVLAGRHRDGTGKGS
ncbi:DUF421 domain-containing protein [Streptomyces niveus]|uniref:DUF421 domain-containing protein n=1 Tax=Streptomyces niveus TaxID=193462 RepID=A0A1U9QMH8_STRNV|nr:YetF domain-containing protein [Streptomyces niveus]AQU65387.1 DUF421 domain-containing protein [Streptomyces niveus]